MSPRRAVSVVASVVFLACSSHHASVAKSEGVAVAPPAPPPLPSTSASSSPVVVTPPSVTIEHEVLPPAEVERIAVKRDADASFVRPVKGKTFRIVFLPGLCSNAYAYLLAFPEAARSHGGVVAIDGDQPCGDPKSGFHSFTWSPTLQRARVEAALAAAEGEAPSDGFVLVGYSAGASIAQMMHQAWPERFPRLVLIAPPEDPDPKRLAKAHGVVSMSCRFDVPYRMKAATSALEKQGTPSIYLEMPGCTHGNVTEGERLFGEAFDWLLAR